MLFMFIIVTVHLKINLFQRHSIYYFAIPRKRPNEQKRVRLEQPTRTFNLVGCDTQGIKK
jgi:hypothetical protein